MEFETRMSDIEVAEQAAAPQEEAKPDGMSPEIRDALLNDFALSSFRDVADGDYIVARMAYRTNLVPQALWASQQAIEKYIKCVLFLRRIIWREGNHSLVKPLGKLEHQFPLRLSPETRRFIEYLDIYGADRYFTLPYYTGGLEIVSLDRAVWEIRRYCTPYNRGSSPKGTPIFELDLKHIEGAEGRPPQQYRSLSPGPLDAVIRDVKHPARAALVWNNLYFGRRLRRSIKIIQRSQSANSPLALYPFILEEVKKYAYVPRVVSSGPDAIPNGPASRHSGKRAR